MGDNKSSYDLNIWKDFIFIRHAQTSWDYKDILDGIQDLKLNDIGRKQAEHAYSIVTKHITIRDPIIYSSPLQRASETATIFVNYLLQKTMITKIDGLQERYYGDYSKAEQQDLFNYLPDDAESTDMFKKRIYESLILIFKNNQHNSTLIIFSHQKVFEFLAQWLCNKNLKLDHGGICYFKYRDGGYISEILL